MVGAGVVSAAEYRDFMDTQGRAIRGRVLKYDARSKKVTIERDNKQSTTVPIDIFSEADQNYIIEWDSAKGFTSPALLKISCSDQQAEKRKEKETQDITYTDGSVEEDFVMTVTTFEKIAFKLKFKNTNKMDLKNIRVDYRIYYEQSKMIWDENPEMIQHCFRGKMTVPTVPAKGEVSVTSKSVETHNDNINPVPQAGGDQRRAGEGDVIGFRAQIYMKMASGEEVMREFCQPNTLSLKKYPWDAPRNSESAKKRR